MKKLFTPLFLSLFLIACGGGSESSNNTEIQGLYDTAGAEKVYFLINEQLDFISYEYINDTQCYKKEKAAKLTDKGNNNYQWNGVIDTNDISMAHIVANSSSLTIKIKKDDKQKPEVITHSRSNKKLADLTPICE